MTESWDWYRTFDAVVTLGSLSAAARELGLTQPTVGRHIDSLEAALGGELFTRSPTGLQATELAREIAPYAAQLGKTSAALHRAATARQGAIAGTVRVSAPEVLAVEVLPAIVAELQEAHPELVIELSASDAIEDLLHREADVAVRAAEPAQEALLVRKIGELPVGMFAHRRYLARRSTPQTLAELAGHRFVGFDRQTAYIRAMAKRYPRLAELRTTFRADSSLAQLAAIRAAVGIGLCQTGLAIRDRELVRVVPSVELALPCYVAMHEDLKASVRCRAVFDALATGLKAYLDTTRRS
jgi:DNA-binding transcriptional LysR family regulator